MKALIKRKHILNLARELDKVDFVLGILGIDYNWFDISEKEEDFFCLYAMANNNIIDELYLKGSNNGEIWDLELEMKLISTINPNFSIFELKLYDKDLFPRAFILKGIGSKEYYDNNNGRNYVIKKGRGGNLIPRKEKLIKLNHINLYNVYDKN